MANHTPCINIYSILLAVFGLTLDLTSHSPNNRLAAAAQDYELDIRMPSVVSNAPDSLICTGREIDPKEAYIIKFTPHASKKTAHHMMVYGCHVPANHNKSWTCEGDDLSRSENSVCGGGQERQILFAWALDAPAKALPEGVGFRISGSTQINHLIVQIHYTRKFSEGETDGSGVTLLITHKRPPQQMGYYVLVHGGIIEPQREEVHLEAACRYEGEYPIYPIGYRTHSHNLGVLTSGYRIRNGRWTEIGRMSPMLAQTFYPVTNPGMVIRAGDTLAARCTMNSMTRTEFTRMGPKNHDEMCNFYIMYSTYNQENLTNQYCFSRSNSDTWKRTMPEYTPPPSNVSSLEGIPEADDIRKKFHI